MRDMMNMIKQAKNMQKNMESAQARLAEETVIGTSPAVEVEMTCTNELKRVTIKPEAVDPEDVETLEDLVLVAVKDALTKAQDKTQEEIGKVTGGMNIPGLT